jgi:protein-S-isoprenylcysteine O-methyltransferase Ste14
VNAQLVTTGIYARARHPIFGAWILMGWGFGVALSPWAIPVAALLTLELVGKTAVEERFLAARYPSYREYRARVPHAFLPRLQWPPTVRGRNPTREGSGGHPPAH